MALVKSQLAADLEDIATQNPDSYAGAAALWAEAVASYASDVTPAVTTLSAAQAALEASLAAAFATFAAAPLMETAFVTFGAAVATAMAPAFVGTPPPGPVGFVALFSTTTGDASQAANDVATAIDTWMKTGTATPSAGGSPVPWS